MSHNENPWRAFDLGYVTIELETAFIVGAYDNDNLFDSIFVSDGNGLPTIPGESLAGILRHAMALDRDPKTDELCKRVFGFQARGDGAASKIRVSYAHPHDANDRPIACRSREIPSDPVVRAMASGVGRDHVRIGLNGTVDDRGKFDELLVPAGARFTFELSISHDSGHKLNDILSVLARPEIRIGGKTRNGLGKFKLVRVRGRSFDLRKRDDVEKLSRLPVALEAAAQSPILENVNLPQPLQDGQWLRGQLNLKPIGSWYIGGGSVNGREPERGEDKTWDRVPVSERRIHWEKRGQTDIGSVTDAEKSEFFVPGTSVKGALRHRCGFHARRLNQRWLEQAGSREVPVEESYLFGSVREDDTGQPGRVVISDSYLEKAPKYEAMEHVSLDRFTQGPMDHLLYDELALGDCELKLEILVKEPQRESLALKALEAAISDLCNGRLSLGAGRGHGRFRGTLTWADRPTLTEGKKQ